MSTLCAFFLMFLAACSFGASAIVIKLAYHAGLQPAQLLPNQNLLAVLCLWPMLLISEGFPKLAKRQVGRLAWQGLIGNFGISICYYWAAKRIDISLLSIILFTYPGLVLFYQVAIEGRRVAAAELAALVLAFTGVVLAVDPFHAASGNADHLGLLLATGAAAAYAFMNVYGEKLTHELSPQVITTISTSVSTLGMVAVLPPQNWLSAGYSPKQWLLILASGILSTVLPVNLMFLSIRKIGAFHASVISIVELPCILVLAYIILEERMSLWQMLGGAMILFSMVLLHQGTRSPETGPATDAC